MENRKGRQWSRVLIVMIFMALILTVTVAVSPPVGSRTVRTLGSLLEKLREAPGPRTSAEIRERWRVTRPGMLLSKDFVPKGEAPGLRELKAEEKQAGRSRSNP